MDTEYIKEVLEDDIERLGCKVWGLEMFGRRSNQTLRIYIDKNEGISVDCLLYTSPSPRDAHESRMPSSA